MIQINQVKIPYCRDYDKALEEKLLKRLRISKSELLHIKILKKSIDARKKPENYLIFQVCVQCKNEKDVLKRCRKNRDILLYTKPLSYRDEIANVGKGQRIHIIGAGPAGLFCAYYLAKCGFTPVVIERGKMVDERKADIERFWEEQVLNPESNVSFGEGGAGTFSDGKLNTGVKDKFGRIRFVLETFVECGAKEDILFDSKPHIGSDSLQIVIKNLREKIIELGGEFIFETKWTGYQDKNGTLTGIQIENKDGEQLLEANHLVLAIGHSARDTFSYLYEKGLPMVAKDFAIGVRVEHLQSEINKSMYGTEDIEYPASPYKCTAKASNGRGVYSFCMCPGGFVVNASSEEGRLCVNGMSNSLRDEKNANSAIVVTVSKEDFQSDHPLAGVEFQRELEKKAYLAGNGLIPIQRFEDFEKNIPTKSLGRVTANTKGGTIKSNVREYLPQEVGDAIVEGMHEFGKKIAGFDDADVLMEGLEARTSSPVRILRNDAFESSVKGIYPCGEGAGYAGGITSAAVDGLKIARQIQSLYEVQNA